MHTAILRQVEARAGELRPNLQLLQQFNAYQTAGKLIDVNARLQHYLRWRSGMVLNKLIRFIS